MAVVDAKRCVRCGACASVAPGVFALTRKGIQVGEGSSDPRVAAAVEICPMQAISATESRGAKPELQRDGGDFVREALCFELARDAEMARWRMGDVPWAEIDRARVMPGWVELVRAVAFSELTTASATQRFLTDFARDVDLTQWIAVWFYEESRHPQVLMRWLAEVGSTVDEAFVLRGRATAPFMKSQLGTLVANIISEIVASSAYALMAEHAPEPVLARIARQLAGDEARHAASFYRYAERYVERGADPRDALKVLHLWVGEGEMRHPVHEFHARNRETFRELALEPRFPVERIVKTVGALVGLPLESANDVREALRGAP